VYNFSIEIKTDEENIMINELKFKKVDLAEQYAGIPPRHVYNVVVDPELIDSDIITALKQSYFRGNVRNIRICKNLNRTWSLMVATADNWGHFDIINDNIKTLKEAKSIANLKYNLHSEV
jgi:hypothetical protein